MVTLGGLTIFRGLTLTHLQRRPDLGLRRLDMRWFGNGLIGPVPVPVIIFAVAAILCHIVLRYTRYGRAVYAVGGNAEAARLSGLRVDRILISVYVIVGFFAGLAAFVLSARLNSSEAVAGIGYELTVISAVVIGGTIAVRRHRQRRRHGGRRRADRRAVRTGCSSTTCRPTRRASSSA